VRSEEEEEEEEEGTDLTWTARRQPGKGSGVCLKSVTLYPPFYILKLA
jgi:hypothetical protein